MLVINPENINSLIEYFAEHQKKSSSFVSKKDTKRFKSSCVAFDLLKEKSSNIVSVNKKQILMKGSLSSVSDPIRFHYQNSELMTFRSNWTPSIDNCFIEVICRKAYISLFSTRYTIYDNVELVSYIDEITQSKDIWKINPNCPNLLPFKKVTDSKIRNLIDRIGDEQIMPEWLQNHLILS